MRVIFIITWHVCLSHRPLHPHWTHVFKIYALLKYSLQNSYVIVEEISNVLLPVVRRLIPVIRCAYNSRWIDLKIWCLNTRFVARWNSILVIVSLNVWRYWTSCICSPFVVNNDYSRTICLTLFTALTQFATDKLRFSCNVNELWIQRTLLELKLKDVSQI